ncbi:MAG: hydantoinase/oxoprolinase family protein, partial [Hyphomonadaceae bacterium]|nr:hydantoinase/oxoprolinase family protein [Hyphomonadaceae bacterium]
PPNFEQGVLATIEKANIKYDNVGVFAHGTTVVINALTERRGVKTALITTEGFRDVLEIARGNRPDFFNLRYQKPEPFVPRYLRREVPERMNYKGEVLKPLDLSGLDNILDAFKADGVEAIAVSLLHAYANPDHEAELAEAVRRRWPEVSVVASHRITREWREYERTNTTVLCAYIQPTAQEYLQKMENRMSEEGFGGSFYVMQSNGGIDTVAAAKATPITMVESGPASGVLGAAALGRIIGERNIIALDIGGTTAKCSLIDEGRVKITSQYMIGKSKTSAGYPIMTPVVDIVEIGNGGGSIAWVDEDRKLHVGPKSAGALPGPVAYGKGGTEPTTTDANLMLQRINPQFFIGGEIEADMDIVQSEFTRLGKDLGLTAEETARGVVRIANNNMINALKLVSINRGYDPRDFTMIAFGGGGAMHAAALAKELNIPKVIIPAHSAVFSAWGMLMSDLRRDYIRTQPMPVHKGVSSAIHGTFEEMTAQAKNAFVDDGLRPEDIYFERYLDLRYEGQEHSVRVPAPNVEINDDVLGDIITRFHDAYEREYTYRLDNDVELVTFHLVAFGSVDLPELSRIETGSDASRAVKSRRQVDFDDDGVAEATIYDRDKLTAGASFGGPAIVEESASTTVVFPGQSISVDEYGNLHISTGI